MQKTCSNYTEGVTVTSGERVTCDICEWYDNTELSRSWQNLQGIHADELQCRLPNVFHEARAAACSRRLGTCILAEYIDQASNQQWNANVDECYSQCTLNTWTHCVQDWDKRRKYVQSMVWPIFGSRTAKEQNRTLIYITATDLKLYCHES